ncbi:hypothetical protein KFU94_12670 [Chloroflexi bacterium TSY]|nr:hypothetical protein [Chloroflexi bacterium TSY]
MQTAWIIEPPFGLVAVYRQDQERQVITTGEVADPATGIRVKLEDIFR